MKRMIPEKKLSKKAKKALDDKKRVTWAFSPTSRVKQSAKVYKRCKSGQGEKAMEADLSH